MRFTVVAVAGALALGACAQAGLTPTDTATMPLNPQGGPAMTQPQAISLASWALKDPANTAGHPGWAARAIAAEDWLAGQTILYGNYGSYAPGGEESWWQLREQARGAIGIPPNAHSQDVVDHLLAAADALDAGHTEAAKAQLTGPTFSLGPDGTLQALTNLPRMPGRDWAFAELQRYEDRSYGGNSVFR